MKNIIKILVFIVSIMILLGGCTATTVYLNQGVQKYSPTQMKSVKIFAERNISKEYTEIGYVAVHHTNTDNGDDLKNLVREEAASVGADAVVNFKIYGLTAGGIAVKYK
jgi:hypothetical protein